MAISTNATTFKPRISLSIKVLNMWVLLGLRCSHYSPESCTCLHTSRLVILSLWLLEYANRNLQSLARTTSVISLSMKALPRSEDAASCSSRLTATCHSRAASPTSFRPGWSSMTGFHTTSLRLRLLRRGSTVEGHTILPPLGPRSPQPCRAV